MKKIATLLITTVVVSLSPGYSANAAQQPLVAPSSQSSAFAPAPECSRITGTRVNNREVRIQGLKGDVRAYLGNRRYGLIHIGTYHNGEVYTDGDYNLSRFTGFAYVVKAPSPSVISVAITNSANNTTLCRKTATEL